MNILRAVNAAPLLERSTTGDVAEIFNIACTWVDRKFPLPEGSPETPPVEPQHPPLDRDVRSTALR